jgi:ribosomal protein S18 acetylase RimI-like enzyme
MAASASTHGARVTDPSIIIRPAARTDVEALGKLGELMVATHFAFDAKRFIAPSPQTPQRYGEFLVSQLSRKDVVLLVAETDGAVIGYVYAGLEGFDYMALRGPAGALYDIVVDPAHRGAGVGHQLLDAALTWLAAQRAPRVVLSTAEQNEPAQRLFARAGFRATMIEMTLELGENEAGDQERSTKRSKR